MALFISEGLLKMYGLGLQLYFHSSFNRFDCVVSIQAAALPKSNFNVVQVLQYVGSFGNLCSPVVKNEMKYIALMQ